MERPDQQLASIFEKLFNRQSLERNTYIVGHLKPNLELPLSVIFKERKVSAVTNDEKLIVEGLKACDKVSVDETKKTLTIKLEATKSKLVVKTEDKNGREVSNKAIKEALPQADYRIENQEGGFVVYMASQAEAEKAVAAINASGVKLHVDVEMREPYQEIKDNVERSKRHRNNNSNRYHDNQNRHHNNNNSGNAMYNNSNSAPGAQGGFQNFNQFGYGMNPYNKFDRPRGPGYTRRAVESSDDEAPTTTAPVVVPPTIPAPVLTPVSVAPSVANNNNTNNTNTNNNQANTSEKKPKYRQKNEDQPAHHHEKKQSHANTMSTAEVQKRTRLDSENFPSLLVEEAKVEAKVLKHKYSKKEIVDIYSAIAADIKINKDLEKSGIPLIAPQGNYLLETAKPGGRKQSTFEHIMPVRKSST